jgi:hypothetical protein
MKKARVAITADHGINTEKRGATPDDEVDMMGLRDGWVNHDRSQKVIESKCPLVFTTPLGFGHTVIQ